MRLFESFQSNFWLKAFFIDVFFELAIFLVVSGMPASVMAAYRARFFVEEKFIVI